MNLKSAIRYLPYVIGEELLFRVGVASVLAWGIGNELALFFSSLWFALFHWHYIKQPLRRWLGNWIGPTFSWQMVVATFVLGLVVGWLWLYLRTGWTSGTVMGKLFACVMVHWCIGWGGYDLGIVQKWIVDKGEMR